jgi:hypothetical protein
MTEKEGNIPEAEEQVINTPVPSAKPVEEKEIITTKEVNNFHQTAAVFEETTWDKSAEIVDLPSAVSSKIAEAITTAPNQKYSPAWVEALQNGVENGLAQDSLDGAVTKENTRYTQGIESLSGVLRGIEPRFNEKSNQILTGDSALLRALSHLGLGTLFQIPLWHTGIWLTVRAPSESQLLELQRQLIADKITFGRQTYGLIFSNTTAYTVDRLVNFVIQNIHSTTLKDGGDLREIISSHDIPSLIWGLTCAIYPRGFQYRRGCSTDPAKCNHIIEERLNLTKIQWTNTQSLTASQVEHMTNRRIASMTKDSVLNYQKELLDCQTRKVTINKDQKDATDLTLRIPSIAEYVDAGHRWISDIVSMVNKTIGMDADDNERNEYIFNQGQSTSLRQYSHWISSIILGDNNIIESKEDVENILGHLSADDNFRNGVMEKIKEYISTTVVSLVGIPTYDCPACGKEQKSPLPKHTSVIPLDVIQVFFTLLMQKNQRMKIR